MLVLDPQVAGALLCRRLCGCPRGLREGATGAVDIAVTVRYGRVPLLRCTLPGGILRVRSGQRATAACRGSGRAPPTARDLGGKLPGEFREPRRTGWGGNLPDRRPRARCHGPLRTGHPLGTRKRLCPQRGARLRAGRALLRGWWLRRLCADVSAERARRLCPLGSRWQGATARRDVFAPHEGKAGARTDGHDRSAGRTP